MAEVLNFRRFMNRLKDVRLELRQCQEVLVEMQDAEDAGAAHGKWDEVVEARNAVSDILKKLNAEVESAGKKLSNEEREALLALIKKEQKNLKSVEKEIAYVLKDMKKRVTLH